MWQFLTNELIFEILRHFLRGLRLSVDHCHLFPWYLGQICSVWRAVFISSPQFWSTLDIVLVAEELLPYHDSILELVQLALKRSNGHPLSLSITIHEVFEEDTTPKTRTKDIMEMLLAHSMNWRSICMKLHRSWHPTLYRAKGRLPLLRSISVYPTSDFQDIFADAPQVTRVSFNFIIPWRINWPPVTVIHIVNISSLDIVIPILQQTTALEELVIVSIHDKRNPTSSVSLVHLPFLKMLYFPALMLFPLLQTSRLEELRLYINKWHPRLDPLEMELLKTTLSGYFNTLRNLRKLAIYTFDSRDALPIIAEAPSHTRELALFGNSISKQLTFAASCPKLHNLETISIEAFTNHEIPYLLATVKAWAQERQGTTESGIGPFRNVAHFYLDFVPDKNSGILKPVKRLKRVLEEQGIKFVSRIITIDDLDAIGMPPFDVF